MKRLLFFLVFILVGCSSPLKRTYSNHSFERDMSEIMKAYPHDTAVMAAMTKIALAVQRGNDTRYIGKSYAEIISESEKDNLNLLKKNGEADGRIK